MKPRGVDRRHQLTTGWAHLPTNAAVLVVHRLANRCRIQIVHALLRWLTAALPSDEDVRNDVMLGAKLFAKAGKRCFAPVKSCRTTPLSPACLQLKVKQTLAGFRLPKRVIQEVGALA